MSVTIARRLRKAMSPAEKQLWAALRIRPGGLKFRRQAPIGPFVADFFCSRAGLAIEVDGTDHFVNGRPERDAARDEWFERNGIVTVRVLTSDVRDNLEGMVRLIVETARSRTPPPRDARSPSPRNRGED